MNKYENKNILAADLALKSGYYGKFGSTIIKGSGAFEDIIIELKYYLQKIKQNITKENPLIIVLYEDMGRNQRTTVKLGEYKGRLIQIANDIIIHYKYIKYNEIKTFNYIYGKSRKWLRAEKKIFAIDLYNKEHKTKTDNDDLAEAFLLFKYYITINN